MVDFLGEFFKAKKQLQGRPFYVTGESYAGHYVPAVASAVYHASRSGEVEPPINLQGLAIGNGLTDPAIQYGAYRCGHWGGLKQEAVLRAMRQLPGPGLWVVGTIMVASCSVPSACMRLL
jgi:carboxypeptidase C (cathepsin A)